jgi:hypothetical protein
MGATTYFHAVNAGDVITILAGLRNRYEKTLKEEGTGEKAIVYQKIDHYASYFPGATHPTRNKNGTMVCMNDAIFDLLKPLVVAQPYMEDFIKYNGQKYTVDLHRCHNGLNVNMPKGIIQKWTWYATPDLALGKGLANAWITVPHNDNIDQQCGITDRKIEDCMIINFTERYRNHQINYFFLKQYQHRIIFAGTEEEYDLFTQRWELDIPRLEVKDFLVLAQAINQAVGFLGNSSMCWNIAEAMKVPRVLEYCVDVPCCFAITKDDDFGVECLYEGDTIYYVEEMFRMFSKNKNVVKHTVYYDCPVCKTNNPAIGSKKRMKYYTCSNCHTLYCPPINQANMLGGLHEDETDERALQDEERVKRFKWLTNGANILDYGCGKEFLVNTAVKAGLMACGYDPYNPELDVLPSGPFDLVSMIEVAEHLSAPFKEFDDIYDMLRNGGFLYIETSFSDWIRLKDDYCDPTKGHCTIFSHRALVLLLRQKGFEFHTSFNKNTLVFKKVEKQPE